MEQTKKHRTYIKNLGNYVKGHISWNKGKTKETDERIRKYAEQEKGRIFSKKHREKISKSMKGKPPWNKGKKDIIKSHRKGLTLEQEYGKEKARQIKIKMMNRKISKETKNKMKKPKSEEIKRKISQTRKRLFKEGKLKFTEEHKFKLKKAREKSIFPKKDTSIEIKIQNFLKQLGIDFFTHQYIKEIEHGYQCDILIPSMKMVIECDGDYWHKYPVGNDIDKIRTSELINKGFKILRLWENEINNMDLLNFENKLKGGAK